MMKVPWPIVAGAGLVCAGALGVVLFIFNLGDNVGYAPIQPIPFSHKLHAGDMKIPCQYCHSNVDKSKTATIPSMDTCMNCHSVVTKTTTEKEDSPWLKKIREARDSGKAIEWVRVHDLPDFVRFNHMRHIARNVPCATCHGDVANMDRVRQEKTLNMGFCVSCHRKPENNAPIDCETCHH